MANSAESVQITVTNLRERSPDFDGRVERGGIVWQPGETKVVRLGSNALAEVRACRYLRIEPTDSK
jgi:hypothetical protein